ncbi:alpha/beta hydrolase-fold protein [Clostridium sp. C8-1-8]|uniref:alpha/beta hydrolase n=1 Tax=Clostridium sp. C8-1-8 TaxID=2698831 RepID=UPI00136A019C|nr:alpha/beta hydrolase-fold protein [Clostridium sp. C8-1-8]
MNIWETPIGFDEKKIDVEYGTLNDVRYESTTTGTTRKCFVITPAGYDKSKKYPVLYLLHGIGGTYTEWLQGEPVNIIGNLMAQGQCSEMIVVLPNVRTCAEEGVPKDILSKENIAAFDNFINDLKNDLMPFISKNYSVSTKWEDTAIAGLSMGGRESLYIGFSMLDTFAYIGGFSPAPGLLPYSELSYEGQLKEEKFNIPSSKKTPKLILMCNGNNDRIVGKVANTYHEVLEKNNVAHQWYTMDGDHDFGVWKNALYNFAKRIFK